jgi:hypothetical protein
MGFYGQAAKTGALFTAAMTACVGACVPVLFFCNKLPLERR